MRSKLAAAVVLFAAVPLQSQELVSTRCREIEVALDESHSVSQLGECGDDTATNLLWHLDRIDQLDGLLDGRYHRRQQGAGSVVYVMDTGVMRAHAEFDDGSGGSRVIAGFDVTESLAVGGSPCWSGNKATDPCFEEFDELTGASHGTSVASLVAGRNVGVAPQAQIVSIRVMNEGALATTRTYLEGLDAIIQHAWDPSSPPFRTAIVNISGWVLERLRSNPDPHPVSYNTVEMKMRQMVGGVDSLGRPDPNGKRFLFVVAGNNTGNGCGWLGVVDRFPAVLGRRVDGIVTVGGMTSENAWWDGACRGGVEILAPSQGIFSATITGRADYRGTRPNLRSGTSFAAPIVAGIAARLLGENPNLTPQELESLLLATPSRIADPDVSRADGRVGFVRDPLPILASGVPFRRQSTLEP